MALKCLSADMGIHIDGADAPTSMYQCQWGQCPCHHTINHRPYAATHEPPLVLRYNSPVAWRGRASSHYHARETLSDGSGSTVTRLSLTYAAVTCDRQPNTEEHQGSLGSKTKHRLGKFSRSLDTLRWHQLREMSQIYYSTSESHFITAGLGDDMANRLSIWNPNFPSLHLLS